MIPPLQPVRLRSIRRWLKDNQPAATLSSEALEQRVLEMDETMLEAFESREDEIRDRMMHDKTWGTSEGMTQFPTERLTLWGEVTSEFLPTSVPALVD